MLRFRVRGFIKMNKNQSLVPKYLQYLITIVIAGVLGCLIFRDFGKIQKSLALNFIINRLEDQREKVKAKAAMMTINHYRPDLTMWTPFILNDAPLDQGFLKDCVRYYDLIIDYSPHTAEAYHFAALCRYFFLLLKIILCQPCATKSSGLQPYPLL